MARKKRTPAKSPGRVSPETKRILVEALDDVMCPIGFPHWNEAQEMFDRLLQKPDRSDIEIDSAIRASIIVSMLSYIDHSPEPSPEKLQEMLGELKAIPFQLRKSLDTNVKSLKRQLPHKPGGGRKESLTDSQKREACVRVGTLMGQGVRFRDALFRVGQTFGVGARTIQRAWQKRALLHQKDR